MRIAPTLRSALGALILPVGAALAQGPAQLTIRAENTLGIARPSETIELAWPSVTSQLAGARVDRVRVLDAGTRAEIPSQVVDDDGDGTPDSLIFQGNFAPRETRAFVIEAAAAAKVDTSPVFVEHTMPRDDMAWESDRIAYRMYGQGLWKVDSLLSSGIDVWVKRVRYPIVEKWYAKGHDLYHHDTGEGADFFDVGQSLGAGGTAIWRNGTLYRAANFKSYRILANGPVRAEFEVTYEPWDAAGMKVTEVKRIAIDAGHNLNRTVSTFRIVGGASPNEEIPYAIGLVKRKSVVGAESKANAWAWLTEWGPVLPKDGGHGDLGIAVMLPTDRVDDWKETKDHYLAIARARSGVPVVQYIGAGWTDSGDFANVADWYSYLTHEAQRLSTPLRVTVARAGSQTTSAR
jgi:pectinesterase